MTEFRNTTTRVLLKNGLATLHGRGVLCVVAVTTVLALITAMECHTYLSLRDSHISIIPSLAFGMVMWSWWGAIAVGMWFVGQRHPETLRFSVSTALLQLSAACVLSTLHLVLLQCAMQAGSFWSVWRKEYSSLNYVTLSRFGADLLIYGFVFGISGQLHLQSQRQQDAMHKLELEKQLSEAQLHALQMQLEPHFLFNSLNALNSLVDLGRNKEASQTLAHLNTILRSTLQRNAPEKIPFVEELRVIESYLAIQQVRFADRLHISIETTPEALQGLVPCFLLQPIVENAIHHGIAPMEEGGTIETRVERLGDKLWMQVRDNGAGPGHASAGHGIGIRSTRERLAYFYPNTHEFVARTRETGGYEVTIQIPFERALV